MQPHLPPAVCPPKTISAVLPEEYHTRPAYLKFKNLKTGLAYCQYGVVKEDGKPKDCKEVPPDAVTEEEKQQYRPQVLTSCVCTPGTECKSVIGNAGVASVASTIFVRIALGTLLERFGPVNVQCGLMSFGAFWVDPGIQLEDVSCFRVFQACCCMQVVLANGCFPRSPGNGGSNHSTLELHLDQAPDLANVSRDGSLYDLCSLK